MCSMDKKKIVITGTRGIPHIMGGVEAVVEDIAPRLVKLGYDVTVIRRGTYVNPVVDAECVVVDKCWKGVHLLDLPSPEKKSLEAIFHTSAAIIRAKRMGADIVHINAIGPALVTFVARLLGMKVVFHHHGPDYDRDKWGFIAKKMLKLGEWIGCKCANHTIVISDVIRKLVAERCHCTKNVSLVYNGVNKAKLCHELEYFEELGIEEGHYVLGMCRFVPEKHLHDLVDAYLLLPERIRKEVKLVLAGDTDFEDSYSLSLKKKAREAGVVLTGFVQGSKKYALLTNALCYSLPSSHEGLPIALLEAMSYRLPVIVSAIPANLEVGLPQKYYHECGDVKALAERLEKTIENALPSGSSGPLRVDYDMTKYNWDVIAQQIADIYESL